MSFDVDSPDTSSSERWSGFTDYGTPVQLDDDTVAIIERRAGVEIALWHLNITDGVFRFISSLNEGVTTPNGFDEVVLRREDSDVVAEFILINTTQTAANRFAGQSVIGEINLRTGAAKIKKDKVKHVASEELAYQKLLDKRRSGTGLLEPTPHKVKIIVAQSLSKHGLSFDYQRGQLMLAADVRARLRQAVSELGKDGSDMVSDIRAFQNMLATLPSCPATPHLANQLNVALDGAQ